MGAMAGGLFRRLLDGLHSGPRGAQLRALAANANEATRIRLSQEPELDQRTLEILARRGPRQVRRAVAAHPSLQAATARNLARLDDAEFQAALSARFGFPGSQEAVPVSAPPDMPPVYPSTSGSADSPLSVVEAAPVPVLPAAAPLDAPLELVVENSDGLPPQQGYEEPGLQLGLTQSGTAWPAIDESTDLAADDIDLAFDLIVADLERGAEEPSGEPSAYDLSRGDVAELRLLEVFGRIPYGAAGRELLARLGQRRGAPQLRSLMRLREAGWDADGIALVWQVRAIWNDTHGSVGGDWPLDYWTVAKLVSTYSGLPDEQEVLYDLQLLEDYWRGRSYQAARRLNDYIRHWVANYEEAYRGGAYPPIDLVIRG